VGCTGIKKVPGFAEEEAEILPLAKCIELVETFRNFGK
jgi:hypothetical protein